jgi:hypothetical protein
VARPVGDLATQPIDLGTFEDASACRVLFARLYGIFGGTTRSGKSGGLIVLIHEYAELADEALGAMADTDSIARLGRAVAVTLIAATQRPTQKATGQGAVRPQMDLRICFRVREPRDVDLVLGQGMLRVGWDAHNLNAPGKFLVSAPDMTNPRRARAYLLTDVGELLRLTGISRPTQYSRLAEHAKAGRAVQVSRGRWRAVTTEEPPR